MGHSWGLLSQTWQQNPQSAPHKFTHTRKERAIKVKGTTLKLDRVIEYVFTLRGSSLIMSASDGGVQMHIWQMHIAHSGVW